MCQYIACSDQMCSLGDPSWERPGSWRFGCLKVALSASTACGARRSKCQNYYNERCHGANQVLPVPRPGSHLNERIGEIPRTRSWVVQLLVSGKHYHEHNHNTPQESMSFWPLTADAALYIRAFAIDRFALSYLTSIATKWCNCCQIFVFDVCCPLVSAASAAKAALRVGKKRTGMPCLDSHACICAWVGRTSRKLACPHIVRLSRSRTERPSAGVPHFGCVPISHCRASIRAQAWMFCSVLYVLHPLSAQGIR
jgi:hypothetical protein